MNYFLDKNILFLYTEIMERLLTTEKHLRFSINDPASYPKLSKFAKALASEDRLKILGAINSGPLNIYELSKRLKIPISSVLKHTQVLADADLIYINYRPTKKGHSKMCNKTMLKAEISFEDIDLPKQSKEFLSMEMPLGYFTDCTICAPCGMAGAQDRIEPIDNPHMFFSPERINAELLWFESGFITYHFPNHFLIGKQAEEISFSFEVCSEASYFRDDWPSDITVFVNDKELTTFLSPGDFGGKRGKYTPQYWPLFSTQFGFLKTITVNKFGVYADHTPVNRDININSLKLSDNEYIKFSIGVKENAEHRGGINLFGKNFGNYPQSIVMFVSYIPLPKEKKKNKKA